VPRDPSNYAVFILTHGRPDNVVTVKTLKRHGYTGRLYLLLDDEDETVDQYRARFGDEACIVFDKAKVAERLDTMDQSPDRRAILYARHAVFDAARDLGLDYFVQLDDDYPSLLHRFRETDPSGQKEDWELRKYRARNVQDMNGVFGALIQLLEGTGALTVAMGQGGEMIGGTASHLSRLGWKRKAMNSYVCRTDRPIGFQGRMNEDVTAYCLLGSRGDLFMTVSQVIITQLPTQQTEGGMSEAYLDSGTYVKSFYTVMACPSFVSIRSIGRQYRRIHHHIDWRYAVPKILAPEVRKDGP